MQSGGRLPGVRRLRIVLGVLGVLGVGLGAGCSGPGGAAGPDPKAELRDAGVALGSVHSVTADLTFGPGITLQGYTLVSATSKLKPPSDSDSTFKVKQSDFLVDVRVVTVAGGIYLKVPFTPFTQLSPEQAASLPDPAGLMDPAKGLPALLGTARKPAIVGSEKVDGKDCDKVSAGFAASDVAAVLGNAVKPAGDVSATFWISRSDHLVRRLTLAGGLVEPGKSTTVDVHLHDFDAPLDIAKPV